MKATRRLVALAAAATMTACAAIPMVAMNVSAAKIIVTDTTASGTSSKLKAFQIFDAEMVEENFVVKGWGSGINVTALKVALKADASMVSAFGSGATPEEISASGQAAIDAIDDGNTGARMVADKLATFTDNPANAKTFAKIAARCVTGDGTEAETTAEVPTFIVDIGYYIIVDTSPATKADYTAYTLGILKVATGSDELTVTPKREYPTFDKKIGDRNDSVDTTDTYTYGEAADHDIGDAVPFQLIAQMPSNIGEYTKYSLKFYDDLQADVFELDEYSFKVHYVQTVVSDTSTDSKLDVDVTGAFTKKVTTDVTPLGTDDKFNSSYTDKTLDFTVECADIKGIEALLDDERVDFTGQFVVEYTATLTNEAKLGATGNWNGAYLEYSNNPNWAGSGTVGDTTGKSPVDYVVAFTYQAIVNKEDGVTKKPLAGAEFTLYKKVKGATGDDDVTVETGITPIYNTGDASTATSFEFRGLDDGTYVLMETKVPVGYTGAAKIEFTISTTKDQADGFEALKDFASNNAAVTAGNVYTLDQGEYKNATDAPLGAVSVTVANKKGSTLPSTGGIGTTIFYVVGSLMVGVAGVYLIAKKRMKNTEQ